VEVAVADVVRERAKDARGRHLGTIASIERALNETPTRPGTCGRDSLHSPRALGSLPDVPARDRLGE
jgi:hypothetical protein